MNATQNKEIPLVPRSDAFKNILKFMSNPLPYLQKCSEEYGETFAIYAGGMNYTVISIDPEVNRHVLQTNHRNYQKSYLLTDILGRYVGNGLLTSNGSYWLRQRRMIQPGFHRAKLQNISEIMLKVMDHFIMDLERDTSVSNIVEIDDKMMQLAFKMVSNTLFTDGAAENKMEELNGHITALQTMTTRQIRQPYLGKWFDWSGKIKKHESIAAEANQILLDIIKHRRASGKEYDDLLDMLLSARYEDTGEGMNDQQLLEESLILFVAGHETTATAMAWTFYLLTQNPEVVDKIRAELNEKLGDRPPQFEDFRQLTYLTQVIQESMRVYPPAWTIDRVAIGDDEIKGFKIRKGTVVMNFIYGVHHSENYWEHPEEFNPDRFDKSKQKGKPNFAYFPFGGGPRLCIGNSFAMMEMQIILCQMLRKYDVKLVEGQTIDVQPLITLRPRYPIKIALERRSLG